MFIIYAERLKIIITKKKEEKSRLRFGIQLTGATLSHICACPKPGHIFPTSYVVVFIVLFSELR
jgi:hypothetical protein